MPAWWRRPPREPRDESVASGVSYDGRFRPAPLQSRFQLIGFPSCRFHGWPADFSVPANFFRELKQLKPQAVVFFPLGFKAIDPSQIPIPEISLFAVPTRPQAP